MAKFNKFGSLTEDELQSIKMSGKRACKSGVAKNNNPWIEGSDAARKWDEGWDEQSGEGGGNVSVDTTN